MFSRSTFFAAVAASTLGALVAFFPATAHATVLTSCGNIDLAADGSVTCTGTIDANCSATCVSKCTGGCTAGSFSCQGSCEGDCNTHCSTQCSSDAHQDECTASCKQTCGASCQGSCSGSPPSCTPVSCQAACQGSCQAQANFTCDISCQEMGYASCQSNVTGGCNTQCSSPAGALFCNGQFINIDPTQLQACEAQLTAELNITFSASGSCSGNSCTGQAAASCGQIAPGAVPMSEGFLAVGLGAGIVGAVRRRVRKAKKA